MPRYQQIILTLWRMPNNHPVGSSILTGLWGVCGLVGGILVAVSQSVAGGVFLSLIGAALLGLVIYAGYDTNWFQDWNPPEAQGTEIVVTGHPIARRAGPYLIIPAFLFYMLLLGCFVLANKIFDAWGGSHR